MPTRKCTFIMDEKGRRFIPLYASEGTVFRRRPGWWKERAMVEIKIEEGFLDCPKFGIIGELRCVASCKWFLSKKEDKVECKYDEDTETE